jgi:hypothetical protein
VNFHLEPAPVDGVVLGRFNGDRTALEVRPMYGVFAPASHGRESTGNQIWTVQPIWSGMGVGFIPHFTATLLE